VTLRRIEVAERFGVSHQAVYRWLRWHANEGLDGSPGTGGQVMNLAFGQDGVG
jgi:transposase